MVTPKTTSTLCGDSISATSCARWAGHTGSSSTMSRKELEDFQRTHIVAATREVRPDIVRALFQYMKGRRDTSYLHRILLWSDKQGDDPVFFKVVQAHPPCASRRHWSGPWPTMTGSAPPRFSIRVGFFKFRWYFPQSTSATRRARWKA